MSSSSLKRRENVSGGELRKGNNFDNMVRGSRKPKKNWLINTFGRKGRGDLNNWNMPGAW